MATTCAMMAEREQAIVEHLDALLSSITHLGDEIDKGLCPCHPSALGYPQKSLRGDRYCSGFIIADDGLSSVAPAWSSLTAYDLNEGTIQWKIPLGEVPELAARGFRNTGSRFPKVGPVVTAGGLIFTGTRDRKVRALDAANGRVLWGSGRGAGGDAGGV